MILRGSSHKKSRTMVREVRTAQVLVASPRQSEGEEDEVVSILDPTDSFSDPEQAEAAVTTVSTLDRATADFEVEETTGPPLSEAMAQRVGHIIKMELQPANAVSNAPSISAKKVNPSLFNKRGGGGAMAAIRDHDLQLQSIQKVMTKAMLPLVRLADSFLLAESDSAEMPSPTDELYACLSSFSFLATANLQMDQLHRDGIKAALQPEYKGLTTVPDPPTELLFGDLDKRMKDLDEKAKLETNLQPGPSKSSVSTNSSHDKAYTPRNATKHANYRFPSSTTASKNLRRFPTIENLWSTSGKQSRGRKSHTKR